MKLRDFLLTILAFISLNVSAQLTLVKEWNIKVSIPSVDRLGNFYFVLTSGIIQKYDPNGVLLDESTENALPLTLVEPWNPLKVFTYSNQTKKYKFWDHHLVLLEEKALEPSFAISPQLVCPDNEIHKAWIFDDADFSLKKVNLLNNTIELDSPIPADWGNANAEFVFMREYQNRVFLLDKNKGILMLNHIGKLVTGIEVKGLSFFNFLGQELCYRKDGQVLLFDLHTGETRKIVDLSEPEGILFTIITDERLVVGREGKVAFYSFSQ